jgi:hypothetical protein
MKLFELTPIIWPDPFVIVFEYIIQEYPDLRAAAVWRNENENNVSRYLLKGLTNIS